MSPPLSRQAFTLRAGRSGKIRELVPCRPCPSRPFLSQRATGPEIEYTRVPEATGFAELDEGEDIFIQPLWIAGTVPLSHQEFRNP